ncbi:MAG: DUF922 domain-containing protein, partial [Rhodothermales bacterium]|nr:DUF922 domain-containing protein [Rhodothermales bacterium]
MRCLPFLLAVLPLLAAAQPYSNADPEVGRVEVITEEEFYDVEGATAEALAGTLLARGPRVGGKRFFGKTEWEVMAEYRWVERATGCAIEDLDVYALVTVRLPRWQDPHAAPPTLRQQWSRFISALERHERRHRDLAEEAAHAIRWRLVSVRARTCDAIEAAAQREVQHVLDSYERRQRQYDEHTGHGQTQGATWPPREEPSA